MNMKTNAKVLCVAVLSILLMHVEKGVAQGRDHDYRREKRTENHYTDRHRHDSFTGREWHGQNRNRYNRMPVYHRPPHHAPAHGYRNNVRYVYYRDYDVYFDCYRGMYIVFTGRNWTYTPHMPVHMHRAPFERIAYVELDYCDDDLPRYIERRRSGGFVSIQARF
jgi:hypothetical protein